MAAGRAAATVRAGSDGERVTVAAEQLADLVASRVVDVPDFPKPGVVFKDLSPLFADGPAFRQVVDGIVARYGAGGFAGDRGFDVVAGIEARGFVVAAAIAYATGTGVVPIRKAGKLPRETYTAAYALEYGEAALEVHRDAFPPGQRVLLVDDVLATGGTAAAACELVELAKGEVAGITVLLEIGALGGRSRLVGRKLHTLLTV